MSAISKDHQAVGLEISKLREQQGLSQIDLATDTGLNKNTIGAMERGESDFGISKLISVCEALQASPNDLLPDRLSRNDTLSSDMQKLQDRLSQLSPYQRAQCMTMINAMIDGVTGSTGQESATCPYNQFGSGGGQAKACKNKRLLYILPEGELLPQLFALPTGSLKPFTPN